jgi:hypothetical protein
MFGNPMKKETIKIQLRVEGIEIPITLLTYNSGEVYYVSIGNSAKILATYIKSKHPHLMIERSSSSFAGGDSITLYIPNASKDELEQINVICEKFTDGKFDGMNDYYDHKKTEDRLRFYYNNKEIYVGAKYILVNNYKKEKAG